MKKNKELKKFDLIMKFYTDIEQSKELAEILPLESADMHYATWTILDGEFIVSPNQGSTIEDLQEDYGNQIIPCWSLAALINIIPQEIFDREYIINITEGCDNRWVLTYDHFENRNHSYYGLSTGADNLVDACVEMIIKLKELNLL